MKSRLKTIVFLSTAVIGLCCCSQVFKLSATRPPAGQQTGWQLLTPESRTGTKNLLRSADEPAAGLNGNLNQLTSHNSTKRNSTKRNSAERSPAKRSSVAKRDSRSSVQEPLPPATPLVPPPLDDLSPERLATTSKVESFEAAPAEPQPAKLLAPAVVGDPVVVQEPADQDLSVAAHAPVIDQTGPPAASAASKLATDPAPTDTQNSFAAPDFANSDRNANELAAGSRGSDRNPDGPVAKTDGLNTHADELETGSGGGGRFVPKFAGNELAEVTKPTATVPPAIDPANNQPATPPQVQTPASLDLSGTFVPQSRPRVPAEVKPAPGHLAASGVADRQTPVADAVSEADRLPALSASQIVEQRAGEHVNYGKSLARRGAMYAARQEFIQALRLIAESHDMNSGSRNYTGKLASALRALKESDDFVVADSEKQLKMDVGAIAQTHTTRLVDPQQAAGLSPIRITRLYYDFATREMTQAVGRSPVAGEALHSLGKLLTISSNFEAGGRSLDRARAMVMHQVALNADPNHHQSANELGVLMARNGRWQTAYELFTQSLRVRRTPGTWRNLAKVHQQLAQQATDQPTRQRQNELAALAFREYEMLAGSKTTTTDTMAWVSREDFVRNAAVPELQDEAVTPPARSARAETEPPRQPRGLLRNVKNWF